MREILTIDYILARGVPRNPREYPFRLIPFINMGLCIGVAAFSFFSPSAKYSILAATAVLLITVPLLIILFRELRYLQHFLEACAYYDIPQHIWEQGDGLPDIERLYLSLKCQHQHNSNGSCLLCRSNDQ